jgi:hypothetical protein
MESFPVYGGVEKTGNYRKFALGQDVQDRLNPGSVAMITSNLAAIMEDGGDDSLSSLDHYFGKRFLYRSIDGSKTFVIMLPPRTGKPYSDKISSDDWENYPHLKTFCEYVEKYKTDRFGLREAALDILSEANHAASLPARLSEKYLREMFFQRMSLIE